MGNKALDTCEPVREGAHVYAHDRKDGKPGTAYVVINNSRTESTTVELPGEADVYVLAGEGGNLRAPVMTLNGNPLVLGEGDSLPAMDPVKMTGTLTLAPCECAFILL